MGSVPTVPRAALISCGLGSEAAAFAREVHDECERREIVTREPVALSSLITARHDRSPSAQMYYQVFYIVLDGSRHGGERDVEIGHATRAVGDYRHWRPGNFAAVRAGNARPAEAGVVIVVAPHDALERVRRADVCWAYPLETTRPPDVFEWDEPDPGHGPGGPGGPTGQPDDDELERLWQQVRELWGLPDDVTVVPGMLEVIAGCREIFETPSKPAMFRPLPESSGYGSRNRFDLIFEPDQKRLRDVVGETGWRAFTLNGATIIREHVMPRLRQRCPTIERPGGENKDAQKQLRLLVEHLRQLVHHPGVRTGPDADHRADA